jgi:tyrosyl-tRNA synthetase
MASYREQAGMILEFDAGADNPVEVVRNSEWLLKMDLGSVLGLMSRITAQRLLERDMFQVRMKKGEPLGYVETIYPLLQGYDSVAMEVDAEVGGRDQLFNMLVGRDLAKSFLDKDKHVLTTPLLPGFDGRKMSKTYGNTVNLRATPFELYDGIMRVHDELILLYARLLTDLSWPELARLEADLADDPMAVKERVAHELTAGFHGADAAAGAELEYVRVRREGSTPKEMDVARVPSSPDGGLLLDYLAAAEPAVAASKAELKRLVRQGGLTLGDDKITDVGAQVRPGDLDGKVLRLGKKRFFRLTVS